LLKSDDANVRSNAVIALGDFKDKVMLPYIFDALKDPNIEVKTNAVLALENFKDDTVINALISSLNDADIRQNVVVALSKYDDINIFSKIPVKNNPSLISAVIGLNPNMPLSVEAVSLSNLYSKIELKNLDEIIQTPLPNLGPDIYGTKAVAYVDDYGLPKIAFLTETVNTHHRHALAVLVGGEKGQYIYDGNYDLTADVLARSTAYELQYDRTTGQIIGIKRDAQTVKEQVRRNIKIQKGLIDMMDDAFLENIDESILENLISSDQPMITPLQGFEELIA
jgi:hypothetical protein